MDVDAISLENRLINGYLVLNFLCTSNKKSTVKLMVKSMLKSMVKSVLNSFNPFCVTAIFVAANCLRGHRRVFINEFSFILQKTWW